MKILITGANGQLGSEIRELSVEYSHQFFFEGSKTLDITDFKSVEKYIQTNAIDAVINCGAYTAVDKAEEDIENAEKVNIVGVQNLVTSLERVNGKLIHISTDYVFDGKNYMPYQEGQKTNPVGVYGSTKRAGEEFILNSEVEGVIIRTSWVYSSFGNNFVKTMMRLGNERDELGVIFDQIGSPTYARDLAKVCLEVISSERKIDNISKIYHFANEGVASWFDFAKAIMEFAVIDCTIKPLKTKDYPTIAKRPYYSVLHTSKIKQDFTFEIPYWRDSLKKCIELIQQNN